MNSFIIVAPCYNEEEVVSVFLSELETTFAKTQHSYKVIIVDDCSTDSTVEKLKSFKFKSENCELKIISLKYNVGHQGAIRQGLIYASRFEAKGFIVMDSDGEDDPEAILQFVQIPKFDIAFVSRGKRSESLSFRIGYFFYKAIFKMISGRKINFGNYSMISKKVLDSVSLQHYVHYSTFLSKLKFKKEFIKFDRRKRIDGKSKMNMNGLVLHGLRSLIEYSEELLFFFIRLLALLFLILFLYGGYVVYSKFINHDAMSGWTSTIAIGLINSILIISATIILGLLILSQKGKNKNQGDIYTEL